MAVCPSNYDSLSKAITVARETDKSIKISKKCNIGGFFFPQLNLGNFLTYAVSANQAHR